MAKRYDWEVIEREYKAGMLSIREVARRNGCAESTVRLRAKKSGWVRDLTKKVRKAAQQKMLRKKLRTPNATEEEIVEEASDVFVEVQSFHRKDISGGREFVELFYDQLREAATNRPEIEDEIYDDTKASDEDGKPDLKRRGMMMRAVSLPTHAGILRDLTVSLKNLIPLERQAYNMDEQTDPNAGMEVGELERTARIASLFELAKKRREDA